MFLGTLCDHEQGSVPGFLCESEAVDCCLGIPLHLVLFPGRFPFDPLNLCFQVPVPQDLWFSAKNTPWVLPEVEAQQRPLGPWYLRDWDGISGSDC